MNESEIIMKMWLAFHAPGQSSQMTNVLKTVRGHFESETVVQNVRMEEALIEIEAATHSHPSMSLGGSINHTARVGLGLVNVKKGS